MKETSEIMMDRENELQQSDSMPKSCSSAVRIFYEREGPDNRCVCPLDEGADDRNGEYECGKIIKGNHATNLENHIESKHKVIWKKYYALKSESKNTQNKTDSSQQLIGASFGFENFRKPCTISTSKADIERNAVIKVTVDGRPLLSVEDVSYQELVRKEIKALGLDSQFAINRHNVIPLVHRYAENMRNDIKNLFKNQLICLKLDCVSKYDKSFIGINLQSRANGSFYCLTLGIVELKGPHKATYLREVVLEELKKFNLAEKNIYATTTDNGSNLLKLVKILEKNAAETSPTTAINCEDDDDEDFNSIAEVMVEEIPADVLNDCNDELSEGDEPDRRNEDNNSLNKDREIMNDLLSELDLIWLGSSEVQSIRCASHTLQLAIHDAMAETSTEEENLLGKDGKVRKIVKKLKTTVVSSMLQTFTKLKPILENKTRWLSCYDMLRRFLEMKEPISKMASEIPDLYLTDVEWRSIEGIVASLRAVKEATIKLQREDLTLSDSYKIWMDCQFATEQMRNTHLLAESLSSTLKIRFEKLLESMAFKAALFLDPRYNCFLVSDEDVAAVIEHLICVATDVHRNFNDCDSENNTNTENDSEDTATDFQSLLKVMQAKKKKKLSGSKDDLTFDAVALRQELKQFFATDFEAEVMNLESSVEVWQKIKKKFPLIYPLALIINSAPATQCSVERLFSDLTFIYSKYATRASPELTSDRLILRFNYRRNKSFKIV